MRRRPASYQDTIGQPSNLASPPGPKPPTVPSTQGDAIEPWIKGGGATFYLQGFAVAERGIPEDAGVQLVAAQYIPKGRAAWIKRIMIAPCAPPALMDPWRGWDGTANYFDPTATDQQYRQATRAVGQAGLWETPLAWTSYYNPASDEPVELPMWNWQISILSGSLEYNRKQQNRPPFSVTDPLSWYLVPGPAVPLYVYRGGIPGRAINGDIGPQVIQQPPSNPLPTHWLVPEDSTICLWATWRQQPYAVPLAFGGNGPEQVFPVPPPAIYPILPSVGSISGYMQAATRESAAENARFGWGA